MNGNGQDHNLITKLPDVGKIPPQAIDMEEAVLGAMLLESSIVDEAISILTPEMFYKEANKKIFESIIRIYKHNSVIDLLTVTNDLRDFRELESIGGPVYITGLTSKVVSAAHSVYHAIIVKTKYIQREMIRLSTELQNRAFDDTWDVGDLMEFAEKEFYTLGDTVTHKEPIKIGILLNNLADLISKREVNENSLLGVPSGISELDNITMGWQPGDLIIIASRPSMGKSALAIQFGKFAAQKNHPTLLFSLEMTDVQLGERYLTAETGQDSYDLKQGRNIDWPNMERVIEDNKTVPLWIDDSAHMTIYEFRSKVRRAKKRYNIELVICDYLNLFKGDAAKDNMSELYGSISKMFKSVAKECQVAVIALAQLNRSPDMRASSLPKLSDLRNSGEIEQDADIVIFPVRYRAIGTPVIDGRDVSDRANIDVAKNRNGRTQAIEVRVSPDCLKWGLLDETPFPENVDFTEPKKTDEQLKF
ncbi:MAG: replicative DNA helicase [Bacteroidales bacterium]|nr:replicative DNA helicase [Bacteroidales bacterium]